MKPFRSFRRAVLYGGPRCNHVYMYEYELHIHAEDAMHGIHEEAIMRGNNIFAVSFGLSDVVEPGALSNGVTVPVTADQGRHIEPRKRRLFRPN